jgi:tetratricopeptide (TPR) repeat protein
MCLFSNRRRHRTHPVFILWKDGRTIALAAAIASTAMSALSQRAGSESGTLVRARMLLASAHWQDAAPLVRTYLEDHPDAGEAHLLMGQILYRQNQPRPSMAEYVKASETIDLSAFDLRIFALDCAAIPDLPEAEKWLRRAIEKDSQDAANWEALGHIQFSSQQYQAAIESLEHALQLAPRSISAESMIGLCHERLTHFDAAEASYRTAIEWQAGHADSDAVPLTGLGRLLIGADKPEEAIPWLQRAVKAAPQTSEPHEVLGLAYSETGRVKEAISELDIAIHISPNVARLHLMLARIYRTQGDKERAESELQQYQKLRRSATQ